MVVVGEEEQKGRRPELEGRCRQYLYNRLPGKGLIPGSLGGWDGLVVNCQDFNACHYDSLDVLLVPRLSVE
jgi:hypothetical protein